MNILLITDLFVTVPKEVEGMNFIVVSPKDFRVNNKGLEDTRLLEKFDSIFHTLDDEHPVVLNIEKEYNVRKYHGFPRLISLVDLDDSGENIIKVQEDETVQLTRGLNFNRDKNSRRIARVGRVFLTDKELYPFIVLYTTVVNSRATFYIESSENRMLPHNITSEMDRDYEEFIKLKKEFYDSLNSIDLSKLTLELLPKAIELGFIYEENILYIETSLFFDKDINDNDTLLLEETASAMLSTLPELKGLPTIMDGEKVGEFLLRMGVGNDIRIVDNLVGEQETPMLALPYLKEEDTILHLEAPVIKEEKRSSLGLFKKKNSTDLSLKLGKSRRSKNEPEFLPNMLNKLELVQTYLDNRAPFNWFEYDGKTMREEYRVMYNLTVVNEFGTDKIAPQGTVKLMDSLSQFYDADESTLLYLTIGKLGEVSKNTTHEELKIMLDLYESKSEEYRSTLTRTFPLPDSKLVYISADYAESGEIEGLENYFYQLSEDFTNPKKYKKILKDNFNFKGISKAEKDKLRDGAFYEVINVTNLFRDLRIFLSIPMEEKNSLISKVVFAETLSRIYTYEK